jgi:hypothetical protein
MDAVVSGHAGVALLLDGDKLSSIHFGEDGVVPRSPSEVSLLFSGAGDLQLLRDVGPDEVREQLDLESARIDALHLALILLDTELSDETRRTAAEELEEELADERKRIEVWLEGVLYAHPLPASADLMGAQAFCTDSTERTRVLLDRLGSLQPVVKEVYEAWQVASSHSFDTEKERQNALSVVVRAGLFRNLVFGKMAGWPAGSLLSRVRDNPVLREVDNLPNVLLNWIVGLLKPSEIPWLPESKHMEQREKKKSA